jgi:predicted nucleic acid-binding protein
MIKKVYIDVCALCRPYDDQSYARINLETIAVQLIFSAVNQKMYEMVYSPVHIKEISAISDQVERCELNHLLYKSGTLINADKKRTRRCAERFIAKGLGVADAAHLAFAMAANAEFITCDDKLCNKCGTLELAFWAGSPVAFCDKENIR